MSILGNCVWFLAFAFCVALPDFAISAEAAGSEPAPRIGPRVLAFYYPWYGSPQGPERSLQHWQEGATDKPKLGPYSSRAESTLKQHLAWLEQAGVDAIIISWWGPRSYADVTARDHIVPALAGKRVEFCLYLEDARDTATLRDQLLYIYDTYGSSPNHLRVAGKPVVFIYARAMQRFTPAQFGDVFQSLRNDKRDMFYIADSFDPKFLECFDGAHTYNPVGIVKQSPDRLAKVYEAASRACRDRNKLFVATALPGYDDSHIGRQRPIILERNDGETYRTTWKQAVEARADWIAICTFNEWHEGSEIEPSQEYGTQYLDLTRQLAVPFKRR
jgi:hypothetical protein